MDFFPFFTKRNKIRKIAFFNTFRLAIIIVFLWADIGIDVAAETYILRVPIIFSKGNIGRKDIEGDELFMDIMESARIINPECEVDLLHALYKKYEDEFKKVYDFTERYKKGSVFTKLKEKKWFGYDEGYDGVSRWEEEHTKTVKEHPYLQKLKSIFNLENAYFKDWAYDVDGTSLDHVATGLSYRTLIVSNHANLIRLYYASGNNDYEFSSFFQKKHQKGYQSMQNEIRDSIRILGKKMGFFESELGNKELGFLEFSELGLPYPPGAVISADFMRKFIKEELVDKGEADVFDYERFELYENIITNEIEKRIPGINLKDTQTFVIRSNQPISMPGILHSSVEDIDSNDNSAYFSERKASVFALKLAKVANSWFIEKAKIFRREIGVTDRFDISPIIQLHGRQLAGSAFFGVFSTHNPDTGDEELFGRSTYDPNKGLWSEQSYLSKPGIELMNGTEIGTDINKLQKAYPYIYQKIKEASRKLVKKYGPCEVEFIFNMEEIWFIQSRALNFFPKGAINFLQGQIEKGFLLEPRAIPYLMNLQSSLKARKIFKIKENTAVQPMAYSEFSTPGAMQGRLIWNIQSLPENKDTPLIFLSHEENREEVFKILFSYKKVGLITLFGSDCSHEATLCRGAAIPSLISLQGVKWQGESKEKIILPNGQNLKEGDNILIDGSGKYLAISEEDILEEDGFAKDASYGIDVLAFQEEFNQRFIDHAENLKPEYSEDKLISLFNEAKEECLKLESTKDKKEVFIASLRKHFLHLLLKKFYPQMNLNYSEDTGEKN